MAQNFVGSNNINLLSPNGQFGTRLQGGSDSASERYIHTCLCKITRLIFPEADDAVLKYLDDDGTPVEPIYYAPIIPMVLVNGSKGIGTGFSTDIMCYNPADIISYIRGSLNNTDKPILKPYYEGFNGTISQISDAKWLIKGCYEVVNNNEVRVTELPVGSWTDDYKKYIEDLIDGGDAKKKTKREIYVKDYTDMSTDVSVDITIVFAAGKIAELRDKSLDNGCNALEKLLKLYTTRTTTNMHMFDENEKLRKYETVSEIADHYIGVRLNKYVERKKYQLENLEKQAKLISNKARFISEILKDTIDMRRKTKETVVAQLTKHEYDTMEDDADYKYLVKMPMDSVTEENYDRLIKEQGAKLCELKTLTGKTESTIWGEELDKLEEGYNLFKKSKEKAVVKLKLKKNK
jgi:DNA topoisomerase-2